MRIRASFVLAALPALYSGGLGRAQTIQPDTEFRVKLLAPLSTETNRKGDKIASQVISPQEFEGDTVEGEVKESKSGGKIKGKSVLNFTYQTLNHGGQAIPIESQVKAFLNSKGQQNVDEEGRVIEKKNNLGKAAIATGAGALLGGAIGGGKGAAVGAGVGAAAAIVFIEVGTKGPNVTFAPGSVIVLSVKERNR
ncbi:MAG: hypothetical protein ABSH05_11415 [Bryobacteraceae bacterium]|jgi:hypothetical protein